MSHNLKINGIEYSSVDKLLIPNTDGEDIEFIVPSGTKTITTNGTHTITNYNKVKVNVPIPDGYIKPSGSIDITTFEDGIDVTQYATVNNKAKWKHSRISKTMGSTAVQTYSIPLSEIGFTPRAFAVILYMPNISKGSQLHIAGIACDMQTYEDTNASTSGLVLGSSSSDYALTQVGTSFKGAVSGDNFVFTMSYGYLRPSGIYRFFFWGYD